MCIWQWKKYVYYRCTDKVADGKKIKGCSSVCIKEELLENRLKELGIDNAEHWDLIKKVERINVYQGGFIEVKRRTDSFWMEE